MERRYGNGRAILACMAASSAALNAGFAISFSSIAMRDLQHKSSSIVLDEVNASWFGSLLPLTAMCGSLLSGPLMDHLGRRPAILSVVVCFLVCWISIFSSSGHVLLFFGRGLSGLATGMTTAVIPVYISEVSPASLRGVTGGLFSVLIASGLPLGYATGLFFRWRQVAEVGAMLACVTFFATFLLTESPYWLIRQGRLTQARECLRQLRGKYFDVEVELKDIESLQEQLSVSVTMKEVMSRTYLKPLGIGIALMVFQQLSGVNAIFFYSHDIFRRANFHNETLASILASCMQVLVNIAFIFFIDKVGRKKLLILSGVGMATCHIVVGACMYILSDAKGIVNESAIYSYNGNNDSAVGDVGSIVTHIPEEAEDSTRAATWLSLIFVMLYITAYSIGMGPIPFIAFSEMLPQRGRGAIGGLCTMTNWLCAFVVTKTFVDLVNLITASVVFWLFSCVCLLSTVFVWQCMPETRGKTLSEIQKLFTDINNNIKSKQESTAKSPRRIVHDVIKASPLLRSKRSPSVQEQSQDLIENC